MNLSAEENITQLKMYQKRYQKLLSIAKDKSNTIQKPQQKIFSDWKPIIKPMHGNT